MRHNSHEKHLNDLRTTSNLRFFYLARVRILTRSLSLRLMAIVAIVGQAKSTKHTEDT